MSIEKIVNDFYNKLSLKEKIYQTICIHAGADFYDEDIDKLNTYAKEKPYGGIFVGEEIIGKNVINGAKIREAIKNYNAAAKIMPLFSADTENGCGYLFDNNDDCGLFPWQMALGATRNKSLAYEYGKYTAIDARTVGINWSLAPVVDINKNFINPVVSTRAFSDDEKIVEELSREVVLGMQEYGLVATAKHFPGDGTDYRDQHFALSSNVYSVEKWHETYGKIYKSVIDAGIMSIMAGHINFPAYQKERILGVAPPATLSKELMTDLLKGELGFEGIIVSDAICMNGFRTTYHPQSKAEIECFKAGCDVMLWPSNDFADNLERAIENGEVPLERLEDAVKRILRVKAKMGLLGNEVTFKTDSREGSFSLDRRIAEQAVTLVSDFNHQLPKKDIKKVSIIGITNYDKSFESLNIMKGAFEEKGIEVMLYRNECYDAPCDDSDFIIYVTFIRQHHPTVCLDIATSWQTATFNREKIIAVTLGSPYMLSHHFETCPMRIAAYSDTKGCQRAVVDAICGDIEFVGTLPVELPY